MPFDELERLPLVPVAEWQCAGISRQAILNHSAIRKARVRFGDDHFEFDACGTAVWVLPCIEDGLTVDAVAWEPDRPERFSRLECRAWCLGDATFDWWDLGKPLAVWRSPLSWLRNGSDGVVILDWQEARHQLPDRQLVAEDEVHGAEIRNRMQPPAWQGSVMLRKAAA